jgi:UDP-N-acetylglucosamine--N-acetylmuramyl-(pentapeptide) pyrophosphoryl-undecaprenol N-acetylglucosamine transferase
MDQLAARKDELSVVHQTGERDFNAVRTAYARREFRAEVVPFLSNMAERFAWADLIVCRAGAITAAEVAASGRAAIFIPFGRATDSHQLRNAQEMSKAGAGRLIIEPELTADRLTKDIFSLVDRPEEIEQLSSRARALPNPAPLNEICNGGNGRGIHTKAGRIVMMVWFRIFKNSSCDISGIGEQHRRSCSP